MKQLSLMTDTHRQLTETYLYLVPRMVSALTRSYTSLSDMERDDLIQTGSLALCRAAINYDGRRSFKTYAQVVIKHAIYDYWRAAAKQKEHCCSLESMLTNADGDTWESNLVTEDPWNSLTEEDALSSAAFMYLHKLESENCPMIGKGIASLRLQQNGYSSLDLAKHYGVPANRVRAWQSKARKLLQKDDELFALLA